jgi:hypothetical protein
MPKPKRKPRQVKTGNHNWYNRNTFPNIAIPIVNRVFPTLVAADIVAVQPMSGPSGMVFDMDFVYDKKTGEASV